MYYFSWDIIYLIFTFTSSFSSSLSMFCCKFGIVFSCFSSIALSARSILAERVFVLPLSADIWQPRLFLTDILASSFKIVFVLLSFGVSLLAVGIRVSISHYICRDVSSNFLSVSSCLHTLLAICSFRITRKFTFGWSKKRVVSFLDLFIIHCTKNEIFR